MSDPLLILTGRAVREKACKWIMSAPVNSRVVFKKPKRTIPQNERMHAMLTDIAAQKLYHGQRLSKDDYKLLFLDALNREIRAVPNLENNGFVNLGRSSSTLDKDQMSAMIELMFVWGAEHGVVFQDQRETETA